MKEWEGCAPDWRNHLYKAVKARNVQCSKERKELFLVVCYGMNICVLPKCIC